MDFWQFSTAVGLTHWGRATHICVSKLTIIGSDNGLAPTRLQAIIWTNAGILLIRTLRTYFSEILGEIYSFSFSKMHLKMLSAKSRLFSLGLNELINTRQASQSLMRWVACDAMEACLIVGMWGANWDTTSSRPFWEQPFYSDALFPHIQMGYTNYMNKNRQHIPKHSGYLQTTWTGSTYMVSVILKYKELHIPSSL